MGWSQVAPRPGAISHQRQGCGQATTPRSARSRPDNPSVRQVSSRQLPHRTRSPRLLGGRLDGPPCAGLRGPYGPRSL